MVLIFVQLKPFKLGNRELASYWNRLYNQNKIDPEHTHLRTNTEKAAYVKKHCQYIELRLQEEKFQGLRERAGLDTDDFKLITTGVNRNLTLLEAKLDQGLEERIESLPQKAKVVSQDKDILQQVEEIAELDQKEFNKVSSSNSFEALLDMSMAVEVDPDTMEIEPKVTDAGTQATVSMSNSGQQTMSSAQTVGVQTSDENKEDLREDPAKDNSGGAGPIRGGGNANQGGLKCYTVSAEMKLDTGSSIPIWRKANNESDEMTNLRQYIRDMLRFKQLGLLENDAVLINASLVKSGRTDVYAEMPKDAEEDVTKFIKYLKVAYGLSAVELLKELQSIKQDSNESPHTFLSRVINLYYEARNETKKSIEEIKGNVLESNEIVRLFLSGLRDPRVRIAVRSRLDDLRLDTLAKAARNAQMALKESSALGVNHVAATEPAFSVDQITDKVKVMNINSGNRGRPFQRGRSRTWNRTGTTQNQRSVRVQQKNVECFKCKRTGHIAKNCRVGGNNSRFQNQRRFQEKSVSFKPKPKASFSCYGCGKPGHYAKDCRAKRFNKQ